MNEFGPLRLKAFRDSLIAEKLSRSSINHATNRTRRIFKWGVENELVEPRILEGLRAVAGLRFGKSDAKETEPVRPVADAHIDAVLPHCSPQVAAMIALQRICGMRSGEVVQMRTCDINTAGTVWTYSPATHKTQYRGHQRTVYIGPKGQAVLQEWLRADPLGLRQVVLSRLPAEHAGAMPDPVLGYPVSADGKHLLLVLRPVHSLHDVSAAAQLMDAIHASMQKHLAEDMRGLVVGGHRH